MVAPARELATRVLHRVVHDAAWAAPTLDAELRRAAPGRADAALATQIVYGSLRVAPALEASLARHARRPIKVDDWSRAALLGGAFQLMHLERVPPHAVVNDTVELVQGKRGRRLGGFVNAILRKLAAERPSAPNPPRSLVVPDWLNAVLVSSIGEEHTQTLLHLSGEPPSMDLRVRTDVDRSQVADDILDAHPDASVTTTACSPSGLRVSGVGDPRELPGHSEGNFAVQEEGAQSIGWLLGARAEERVLDACAGRGGKTAQLVEAVGPGGHVVATDLHEHRLERISGEIARLRLPSDTLETACVDWTVGGGTADGTFDRVLVDAPCTGLGTLRRRPEILLRSKPENAAQMGETQRLILRNAAQRVRAGGRLLYAVCSPLSEEGADVVEAVDLAGFELQVGRPSCLKSFHFESNGRLDVGPWVPCAGPWADAYQVYMWVNVG